MSEIELKKKVEQNEEPRPSSPNGDESENENERLPLPVGLREVPLSVEAARKIRKTLDDPKHPKQAGREMPTADPGVVLKKSH